MQARRQTGVARGGNSARLALLIFVKRQVIRIQDNRRFARNDFSRYACHDAVGLDIAGDYGVGANRHIVTDGDRANDFCSGGNGDVIADSGDVVPAFEEVVADGHPLQDGTIFTNFDVGMDDDATEMRDNQTFTDTGLMGNFDAIFYLQALQILYQQAEANSLNDIAFPGMKITVQPQRENIVKADVVLLEKGLD